MELLLDSSHQRWFVTLPGSALGRCSPQKMTTMAQQTTLGPPLAPLAVSLHQPLMCAQGELSWCHG